MEDSYSSIQSYIDTNYSDTVQAAYIYLTTEKSGLCKSQHNSNSVNGKVPKIIHKARSQTLAAIEIYTEV